MATTIPDLFTRIVDANGAPIAGAQMFWYLAGTSTPTTVYQDNAVTVPQDWPIAADAGGLFVPIYAKDGSYKVVLEDALGNTLYTLDNYSVATGGGGGTSVSAPVVLKTANYAVQSTDRNNVFIVDASGAAGQNVVITADSSVLTNGFPLAIINVGAAGTVTFVGTGAQTINGAASFTLTAQYQAAQFVSDGATGWVISGSTAGSFINAVTFFAGAQFNGSVSFLEQSLVITSNIAAWPMNAGPDAYVTSALAFTMALPTNIPTAGRGHLRMNNSTASPIVVTWNGVFAALYGGLPTNLLPGTTYFDYEVLGGVIYISYRPAGAPVLLNTLTASNSANLQDITSFTSAFSYYRIVLSNIVPATNNSSLILQPKVSGSFQTTVTAMVTVTNPTNAGNSGITQAVQNTTGTFTDSISNTAGGGFTGEMLLANPSAAGIYKNIAFYGTSFSTSSAFSAEQGGVGYVGSTVAVTGLQFLFSSGNISSGSIKIYGWN